MVAATLLFLLFICFIVLYIMYHKRRIQQEYMAKEKLIYDHNFNLLKTRLEEQEGAMGQISREIHDNVSQKIDFLQMNSKALLENGSETNNLRIINNISSLAEQIGNDLRNISYTLNSDYITAHGLIAVLQRELDYINSSRKTDCRIELSGEFPAIAPESELLIYRIVQEALHNCMKHADATAICILISYVDGNLNVAVTDNGKGFDADAPHYREGLGFRNMQQRAKLLNATLHVFSTPAGSCEVSLEIAREAMVKVFSGQILDMQ